MTHKLKCIHKLLCAFMLSVLFFRISPWVQRHGTFWNELLLGRLISMLRSSISYTLCGIFHINLICYNGFVLY